MCEPPHDRGLRGVLPPALIVSSLFGVYAAVVSLWKVADLDALMNRARRRRTHERQHQTQIMARASRTNEDRAAILLYNNPLHQLSYSSADDASQQPDHRHSMVSSSPPICHCNAVVG